MASIFKRTYYRLDPKAGKKVKRRTKKWYVEYRDHDGMLHRVPGYTDKSATIQLAADLESGRRHPLRDRRPIGEHLEDYRKFLAAKGNIENHVQQSVNRIQSLLEGCGIRKLAELKGASVSNWLAGQRSEGTMSIQTSNYYLSAVKGFAQWLVREQRLAVSPLAHLQALNAKTDRRRERRDLSDEELRLLIEATRSEPPFRDLSGEDRALMYLLVVYTGLRASEVASLTPASFHLDADPPTVTVEADYSKHRTKDVLPLRPDLVEELRRWLATRSAGTRCWPGTWVERSARMLRRDLAVARANWIKFGRTDAKRKERSKSDLLRDVDSAGRIVDFHALRHTFISSLARSGVHPKTAQALARHSTITLTMDCYTHVALTEMSAALKQIPDVPKLPTQTGAKGDQRNPELAVKLTVTPANSCQSVARVDAKPRRDDSQTERRKPRQDKEFDTKRERLSPIVKSSGGGTRTPDTRIMIPLL